jgi:hypothetical protein
MTRTNILIDVVTAELRARQAEIDAGAQFDSVELAIKMDPNTGLPCRVSYRTEAFRNLKAVSVKRDMR